MLERLLESKSRNERSVVGTIVSVTAHTALIAAALYATAQARAKPARTPEIVRPVYFPTPESPATRATRSTTTSRPFDRNTLTFVAPRIDVSISPVDMSAVVTRPSDFGTSPIGAAGAATGNGTSVGANGPFLAEQVEKQAEVAPGNTPPRYPEVLRSAGVEGKVVAVFIVDERGRAEEESIRLVSSDNRLFQDAVRAALSRMRFVPAELRGRKVRQLVQIPFVFSLAR